MNVMYLNGGIDGITKWNGLGVPQLRALISTRMCSTYLSAEERSSFLFQEWVARGWVLSEWFA